MFLPKATAELPIVYEFGSLNTRVGYAGEDVPSILQNTNVGLELGPDNEKKKVFEVNQYSQNPRDYMIKSPLLNNYVYDWELMEIIIRDISDRMGANQEKSPALIIEPAVHNKDFRLNFVELFFEKFNVPSLFFHKAPLLSLYAFAKENALILDIGAEHTHCTPIQDGFMLEKGVMRADVGSELLTRKLLDIIQKREGEKSLNSCFKGVENGKCKVINESLDYGTFCKLDFMREVKHSQFKILEQKIDKLKFNDAVDKTSYELPDKRLIVLSKEVYTLPELFFQPIEGKYFNGMHVLIKQSLEKLEIDVRKDLLSNIILTGGGSLLPNLLERLHREMFEIDMGVINSKVKVYTSNLSTERKYSNWLGGSILSSMSTFGNYAMSKQEYEEHGAILIERKCFS